MKKSLVSWLIRLSVLIALGAGLYMAHSQVVALKYKQAEDTARIEQLPALEAEAARQQAEFEGRAFDISRVRSLLVSRNDIAQVVAAIEREGAVRGLAVTIPEVTEIQQVDAKGKVLPSSGPTQTIGIKVSVEGDPDVIMTFVHSVENLAYLMYVNSLNLQYEPRDVNVELPEGLIPKALAQTTINLVLVVTRSE